jgi:hypothetical protein
MTPIVAPDAHTRAGPRRGRVGGPYDFMRRVLATDTGGELYSRRPVARPRRLKRSTRRFVLIWAKTGSTIHSHGRSGA